MYSRFIIGTSRQINDNKNIMREIVVITDKLGITDKLVIETIYDKKGRLIEVKSSNGSHYIIEYNLLNNYKIVKK